MFISIENMTLKISVEENIIRKKTYTTDYCIMQCNKLMLKQERERITIIMKYEQTVEKKME